MSGLLPLPACAALSPSVVRLTSGVTGFASQRAFDFAPEAAATTAAAAAASVAAAAVVASDGGRGKRAETGAPPSFLDKLCHILGDAELSEHITWNQARHPALEVAHFLFENKCTDSKCMAALKKLGNQKRGVGSTFSSAASASAAAMAAAAVAAWWGGC